jgi:hypothetical protein
MCEAEDGKTARRQEREYIESREPVREGNLE